MKPAETLAKLPLHSDETPLAGPDGQPVGYFLDPDQYAIMRLVFDEWQRSRRAEDDRPEAPPKSGTTTMRDFIRRMDGR